MDKLALQQHLNTLAESYSRSLVKKVLVQYRAVLEKALEQDLIARNLARKLVMPVTRKPRGRFLSLEEFDVLLAQLEFRDRLIVRMVLHHGVPAGRVVRSDVGRRGRCPSACRRVLVKEEPKTVGSDSYLPMPATVGAEIGLWRGMHVMPSPTALVFATSTGKPISPHNYQRDVLVPAAIRAGSMAKPAKERRKSEPTRNKATAVNFQSFRRTSATWMQRTGATIDVQGAMRHITPDQTVKVYMREIPSGVRAAVEDLDRMLNEKRGLADTKARWRDSVRRPGILVPTCFAARL